MLHQDLVLKHNELYLVGEDTSDSSQERATGLYLRDTRFLNFWGLRVNGAPLEPLEVRAVGPDRAVLIEANGALAADGQRITEPVLPLTVAVEQHIELGADLRIRIILTNFSGRLLPLSLSLEIGCDFRDLFDIRGFPSRERGGTYISPMQLPDGLALGYTDRSGATTRLLVSFSRSPSLMVASAPVDETEPEPTALLPGLDQISPAQPAPPPPHGKAFFDISLEPRASWELLVKLTPSAAEGPPISVPESDHHNADRCRPARIATDHFWVNRIIDRAAADLDMLQTSFRDGS